MAKEKRTIYVVQVVGQPGSGTRTADKEYAEQAKELLEKAYGKKVRIVTRKQQQS